ncbi:hypothetical protein, partial [uncultured Dialister sp.]|uniref:hypothetical protein n=1 Tax=uncultured Dialister sp. TaxID=278064 RepID=UPI0025981AFB
KCYFYLCRYLLCHLGWNGWEEQAELIKKEALVERLVLLCCVRYLRRGAFEGESALGCIPEG